MRGSLECGRAMRMDGIFVGQLLSTGSITVGPTGQVTGDLKGLKSLRVEGQVSHLPHFSLAAKNSIGVIHSKLAILKSPVLNISIPTFSSHLTQAQDSLGVL